MMPCDGNGSPVRLNIAIDGPAGAGKSTVARRIATVLGAVYIDTGAMYRACALKALRLDIPMSDEGLIARMMEDTSVEFHPSNGLQRILLDGEDVTDLIRSPEVTRGSSDIAKAASVRRRLVELQRAIARDTDVVMDGRDIGSHVLPDARYKFFLTASDRVRALRRLKENIARGEDALTLDEVLAEIRFRDRQDSTRAISPLTRAADAIEIDTSELNIEQSVEILLAHIRCDGQK